MIVQNVSPAADALAWAQAIGSIFAAVVAVVAAGIAIWIARHQDKREAAQRTATATALGPAVMLELCLTKDDAASLAKIADLTADTQNKRHFVPRADARLLRRTTLLANLPPSVAAFEDDGSLLMSAAASILDLCSAMDAWKSYFEPQQGTSVLVEDQKEMRMMAAAARDCVAKIDAAITALMRRGVGVPPEIIRIEPNTHAQA